MSSIQARNVNHPNHRETLNRKKYVVVKDAILAALSENSNPEGLEFSQLEEKVGKYLAGQGVPNNMFPKPGSIRWYTKAVQLDLEARNIIERVPNKVPIQLRKVI